MGGVVFILWGQGPQICNAHAKVCPYSILQAAPQLSFFTSTAAGAAGGCAFSQLQITSHLNTEECLVSCYVRKEVILPLSMSRQAVPEVRS